MTLSAWIKSRVQRRHSIEMPSASLRAACGRNRQISRSFAGKADDALAAAGRRHSQRVTRNSRAWAKKAATAHPSVSQFAAMRGCRSDAAPARAIATIGATRTAANAVSMIVPMPGITRMSNGVKRRRRNTNQIAAQTPRQHSDAFRSVTLAMLTVDVRRPS
ncbi:MAG TPA: hypothetical protein VFB32_15685 [Rudaea sp.]|nr:hypothetical protein [Rudaea sp.]